jgi:AraC-like DNA-binding protein/mannose-6-phosphate isomerase-like protein (cupin superfamily)
MDHERSVVWENPDWIRQDHVDLDGLWESATFTLNEAYDVVVGPRWQLGLPAQPHGEIWLIRAGVCAVSLGSERVLAQPGEVVFLRPGPRRMSANGGASALSLIGFGCSLRSGPVDLLARFDLPLVVTSPSERVCSLIEETVAAAHGGGADRVFRARALAALAVAELVRDEPSAVLAEVRPELRAVLAFIASHYGSPLDLRALARVAHLSPKQLGRIFGTELGLSPMAYLRRFRLDRARERVATTDSPISRIAVECGFSELAAFSRAFRRQHGVSPRTLRDHSRALRSTVWPVRTSAAPLLSVASSQEGSSDE